MKKSSNSKLNHQKMRYIVCFSVLIASSTFLLTGPVSAADTAELISIGVDGQAGTSDSSYYASSEIRAEAVSAEGRFVVFSSLAENLTAPDDNCNLSSWHVFLRDREAASTTMITCIPDLFSGSSVEGEAAITPGGDVVAFRSSNGNLVENDTNGSVDIFVYSENGLERVSLASDGSQGPGCSCAWPDSCNGCEPYSYCSHPTISADGRFVAFSSYADNFVAGDLPDTLDVFLHERDQGTTEIVSISDDDTMANGSSWAPSISADGDYVVFSSHADNLVAEDNNGVADIFLWERATRTIQRVSVASDGGEANGASSDPVIDAEGKRIVFTSGATNLVGPDANGTTWDVFVHDQESGDNVSLSGHLASGGQRPAISDDGNTVSFTSSDDIYQVDLGESGATKLVVTNMQFSAPSTAGEAIVVSGYNSLTPEDVNGDKDVYLFATDGQVDPPDDTEICDDGIDNDGDGRIDCRDRDCRADPVCSTGGGGRSK